MVSHHTTEFGSHRHWGSEDKMFVTVRFYMPLLQRHLLFISKGHGLKAHGIS